MKTQSDNYLQMAATLNHPHALYLSALNALKTTNFKVSINNGKRLEKKNIYIKYLHFNPCTFSYKSAREMIRSIP